MPNDRHARARAVVPGAACAGFALLLYVLTLAPTVFWSDSAELQRAAITLEPPHPTGYPLYLVLGRLWTMLVPLRDAAWRMNLFSAVTAAAAVGLVTVLTQRLTGRIVSALVAGAVLAVSASFWSQAIVAEVYALHALLVALILIVALRDRPSLPVLALLVGLGLAHHRMTLLLLPGLLAYLLLRRGHARHGTRQLALSALALVVGLALYGVTYATADWPSWQAFADYVFHSAPQFWSASDMVRHLTSTLWPVASQQLSLAGLALGAIGLAWCARRDKPCGLGPATLLGLSWLLGIGFFALYRPPDLFSFAGHYQVVGAVLIGLGTGAVLEWLGGLSSRRLGAGLAVAFVAALAVGIGGQAVASLGAASPPDEEWLYPRRRALQMLGDAQSGSIIVAGPLLGQTARYLRDVEGVRPDITIVIDPDKDASAAESLLDVGRPVYVWGTGWKQMVADTDLLLVPAEHSEFDEGLFRLVRPDTLEYASRRSWAGHFGAESLDELGRVSLRPYPLVADELVELEVCWSDSLGTLRDLHLSVAAQDPGWFDHSFGAIGDAPVHAPTFGSRGCTRHFLVLPPAPLGDHVELEIAFQSAGPRAARHVMVQESVPVDAAATGLSPDRMSASIVQARDAAVSSRQSEGGDHPSGSALRQGTLLGVVHPPDTRPGVGVPVTAYWWIEPGDDPAEPVVWQLLDESGTVVDRRETVITDGFAGNVDEGVAPLGEKPALVSTLVILEPPRRAEAGAYEIRVAQPDPAADEAVGRVEVKDWDRTDLIGSLRGEKDAGLANGAIEFLGFEVTVIEPGTDAAGLDVRLAWRAVSEIDDDWKVFVHLLGPAGEPDEPVGEPAAQSDGFPAGGLRHTDGWHEGEVVEDLHHVALPPGLPDGRYELVIGLYNPETGARATVDGGWNRDASAVWLLPVLVKHGVATAAYPDD